MKIFQKIALITLFTLSNAIQSTISIANLKDTHDILKDYSDWYAPFWGLPFAENDVARNLYVFSDYYNKKQFEEKAKKATSDFDFLKSDIQAYFERDNKIATQTMVKWLFAEIAETFNVSNSENNPVKYLSFKDIGKIIRIIYNNKNNYEKTKFNLQAYLNKTILPDIADRFYASNPQKSRTKTPFNANPFNQFINALIGSLQECANNNPGQLFPEYTTEGILLGYILMKGNNRSDLQDYFEGFLGEKITLPQNIYTDKELNEFLKTPINLEDITSVANYVCAKEHIHLHKTNIPKPINETKVNFKSFIFTNCMETTVLNLINVATYNPENHTMGVRTADIPLSQQLQKFYTKYNTNTDPDIDHIDAKNAFINLAENIPFVYYTNLYSPSSKQMIECEDVDCDGFIPSSTIDTTLPKKTITIGSAQFNLYEKEWNNQTFLLVPSSIDLICFEVRSSLRNIIILLNHLLSLNLYSDNNTTFDQNFETVYFNALCQKLEWRANFSKNHSELIITIETKDYEEFTLNIQNNLHGSMSIPTKTTTQKKPSQLNDTTSEQLKAINTVLGYPSKKNSIKNIFFKKLDIPGNKLSILTEDFEDSQNMATKIFNNITISFGFDNETMLTNMIIDYTNRKNDLSTKIMIFIKMLLFNNWNSAQKAIDNNFFNPSQINSILEKALTNFSQEYIYNVVKSIISQKLLNQAQLFSLFETANANLSNPNPETKKNATKIIDLIKQEHLLEFSTATTSQKDTNKSQSSILNDVD